MKIIAVDFDGTIAKTRYPYIVELMPEAQYIAKWRRMGHKVILWTCRTGDTLEQAVSFCKQNGITFDAINENIPRKEFTDDPRKISADIYIDDKCPMPIDEQWNAVDEMLTSKRKSRQQAVPVGPVDRPQAVRIRGRR